MAKPKKQKYIVAITRTSYSSKNIVVEATNDVDAEKKALSIAGEEEFTENDFEFTVDAIHKQTA